MKISVVIPIYKTELFLSECIESVRTQTLSDLEIILINDGSPDNSHDICQIYLKRDKRIKYFYQKNSGVSVARNLGISKALGEYVYCMDSDDTISPEFLESAYDRAKLNSADICVLGECFRSRMPIPPALPTCGMLIKRSFLMEYPDVRYPEGIQPCEDGLFSHQLVALTGKIAFEPKCFYFYRQHDNSNHTQVSKSCKKVLAQIPIWFKILTEFYNKYNLWNKQANHLLKFLEHEPFGFRLLGMPLTLSQQEYLFLLIQSFYRKKIKLYLNRIDFMRVGRPFRLLLKASNFNKFKHSYNCYIKINKIKRFFVYLNPIRKIGRLFKKTG